MKHAVAGSIVALLLAVTSISAACDLSCAFGMAESDCHSGRKPAQAAMDSATDMSGMDMAGMTMPGTAHGESQALGPEITRAKAAHPSIGDMGPCERQSCDRGALVATRSGRSNAARVRSVQPVAQNSFTGTFAQILHGARDDISRRGPSQTSPLALVLRI